MHLLFQSHQPTNQPPVADAGLNQTVAEHLSVQLSGSVSYDPDGTISHYQWRQTTGSQVLLQNSETETAHFIAPPTAVDTLLNFELIIHDNDGLSAIAVTQVTIQPDLTDGDIDADGIKDEHDSFPNNPNAAYDIDNDGIGDKTDPDRDGDGIDNDADYYPNDATQALAPLLSISTPQDGIMIDGTSVLIQGSITAPPNTGITINGIVAQRGGIPYGSEFAAIIPLQAGANIVTITATTQSRKQVSQTLTINSTGNTGQNVPVIDLGYDSAQTKVQIDLLLQNLWNEMNTALTAGNYGLAIEYLSKDRQKDDAKVFYLLLPYMTDIISTYSGLVMINVTPTYGEYAVGEHFNGTDRVFMIQLKRDSHGVWHVEGM